jgi:hypothetical protein
MTSRITKLQKGSFSKYTFLENLQFGVDDGFSFFNRFLLKKYFFKHKKVQR